MSIKRKISTLVKGIFALTVFSGTASIVLAATGIGIPASIILAGICLISFIAACIIHSRQNCHEIQ